MEHDIHLQNFLIVSGVGLVSLSLNLCHFHHCEENKHSYIRENTTLTLTGTFGLSTGLSLRSY
jgi:hypothetical protein